MLPVVPMVLLAFIVMSPICWFFSGRWLPFTAQNRFTHACLGTVPFLIGMILAMILGIVSLVVGAANPASVLVPIAAVVIGVFASGICVILVLAGRPQREVGHGA